MTWLVFSDVSTHLLFHHHNINRICKLAMMKRYTMMRGQKYIYGFVRLRIAYHVLAQALLLYVTRLLPRPSNINRGGVWLSETRCRYALYDKMFHKYMGMNTVSHRCFHNTFKLLYRPVKELLDAMCEAAKQQMKDMPQNQLGSWSRAVTAGDGVCLTRGCHSQNATFTLRNHVTGALLYYEHMCQRGDDTVTEEQLFKGTSKAAEEHRADNAFRKAYEEGMNIDIHWQDSDSTSANALHKHFNDAKVFLCSGHVAKNHEKRLNSHYSTTNHRKNSPKIRHRIYIKYVTVCSRIGTTFLNTGIYLQHKNSSYPLPQKQFAIFEDIVWYPNRLGMGLCSQKWQET